MIIRAMDTCYEIGESTFFQRGICDKWDVLVVSEVTREDLNRALEKGYKLLECSTGDLLECLRERGVLKDPTIKKACKYS